MTLLPAGFLNFNSADDEKRNTVPVFNGESVSWLVEGPIDFVRMVKGKKGRTNGESGWMLLKGGLIPWGNRSAEPSHYPFSQSDAGECARWQLKRHGQSAFGWMEGRQSCCEESALALG